MIKWWRKRKDQNREIQELRYEVDEIKHALEAARLVAFIKVVAYHRGMELPFNGPLTISIEDLEQRICVLEERGQL